MSQQDFTRGLAGLLVTILGCGGHGPSLVQEAGVARDGASEAGAWQDAESDVLGPDGGTGPATGPCGEYGDYGIGPTGPEEEVVVACGEYGSFEEVVTRGGRPDLWVRFRAERRGCVRLPAGATPSDRAYWILDGVVVRAAEGQAAVRVQTDNVGFEHCELAGPLDVFTGVPSCTEDARQSGMGNLIGRDNVWFHDCEIHGFAQTFLVQDARVRISRCYVHNNRNGLSLRGIGAIYCYNVLWMNPNHGLLVEENGPRAQESDVLFVHNLVVDTQESLFQYGGATYRYLHNTWADVAGQPCGLGLGIQLLDRTPEGPYGGDNLPIYGPLTFVANFMGAVGGEPRSFYRFEVDPGLVARSDYNYVYAADGTLGAFARRTWPEADRQEWSLAEWRAAWGQDVHSVAGGADPQFANPVVEPVPASWREAWERFRPAPTSPLCGAGPNGTDIGAIPCP